MMGKKISKTASVLTLVLVFIVVVAFPTMAKEWNQYLNGPQHRSYINITGLQSEPELKWQYEITGEPGNPVIADDGTVYVSSARNYFGEENAAAKNISDLHLYAFDKNGTLKFDKVLLTMTSNTEVFSSAAPFKLAIGNNGAIFAVAYDPNNQKGYIYSFDASGNINWEKTYDNISLSGEPVISTNNTIYVTAETNMIYAFNGNNGAECWNTDIGGGYLYGCTLSNDEAVLYAGNEWGTVKAIDVASGANPPVESVEAPELKLAEITTKGDLSLTFDQEMASPSGIHNQFAVEVDGSKVLVTAVENTNTPTKIKLVLQNKVIGAKKISIKYTRGEAAGEQLKSVDGRIVDSFLETWEEWTSPGSKPSYQPWTIKFSLDVDPLSVIDNNIYILDKTGIKLAASLSMPDNKTVSLTPKTLYTSGERYILYISKAVRSAAGGRTYLKDNIHMKFTAVPGT